MRVKKISDQWTPSENKSLQIGDIIDISNPKSLVDQGLAIYVDDQDVEYEKIPVAWEYRPKAKNTEEKKEIEVEKKSGELTVDEKKEYIKARRAEILAKARETKRLNDIAKKEKELKKQEAITEKARLDAIEALNGRPL